MEWLIESYNDFVENKGDPRTKDFYFVKSPCFTLTMVSLYLFFSIYAGPKFMKNRKPFDLRKLVILYNFLHMCLSIYLVYWASRFGWFSKFDNWFCYPSDYNDVDPSTVDLINSSRWYHFSRFFEFVDTIFFVLRKKNNQISTLHLVHHSTVPIMTWIGMKFASVGHITFGGYINGWVHIIMYFYYMLSAMGPSVRKYLWWKKYLTIIQLVQFITVLTHTLIVLNSDCPSPKWVLYMIVGQALLFFSLFLQFYIKEYIEKQSKNETKTNFIQNFFYTIQNIFNKILQFKPIFEACIPNQEKLLTDPSNSKISGESKIKQKVT